MIQVLKTRHENNKKTENATNIFRFERMILVRIIATQLQT